ncbi:MAG: 4-hydroxy-tetrahydrodipicolinate synthase [Deltaproteobacteria bacterium]|nr:4-hydroxy-tetrahydrodipicolinate synthase [Deltaproteobacteria bacterium]
MKIEGVIVATVTPFLPSGEVDLSAYEAHLRQLAAAKVHGFAPCATTGEAPTLRKTEWMDIVKATKRVASQHHLLVIPGCGGNDTAAALEMLDEANVLGCDAGLLVTPYYNKPTPRGVSAHYQYLAEHSKIPLVLYNNPSRTAVSMSAELIGQCFQHSNIVGVKDASGLYSQWLALSAVADLKTKALLAGDDDAFVYTLLSGGLGIISASANVAPQLFVSLYQQARAGQWQEAYAWQKKLLPLTRALFSETSPAPLKYALHVLGRMENRLRLPLVPITAETERKVSDALHALELA